MELSLRKIENKPMDFWRGGGLFSDWEWRMDNLLDEVFGGSLTGYVTPETRGAYAPRIDIKETKEGFEVTAEMPGMNREDIDVSVHDGVLTLSGEKKTEKDELVMNYHHVERSYGCFSREIRLPDTVEMEKVEATYKNGVLRICMPKTQKAIEGSRKIPVTVA
jgi:HSP20 family protein